MNIDKRQSDPTRSTTELETFTRHESNVQSYARDYPVVFDRAEGVHLYDTSGNAYLDFLAGAGSLNYGHNHPVLTDALIEYIRHGGVTHGLDMHTRAKARFLDALEHRILAPRGLEYRVQFPGPTGTNAVEAALKLARKVTGRRDVIAFTNGFHGVTLGALAATGNGHHRGGAGTALGGVTRMPYDGYVEGFDTIAYLEKCLLDDSSGVDLPAAVIVETVQGEGGLNAARFEWLRALQALCQRHGILLIVDDIQAGCGRTGTFFSFEPAGLEPDVVVLSKSLSALGLPFAVVLMRPDLNQWAPGEHNGTFRGNNHAFVTATAALDEFWSDDAFAASVRDKADALTGALDSLVQDHPAVVRRRKGRGLMQGVEMESAELAARVKKGAFDRRLVIEAAGPADEVIKCFCPLTIERDTLLEGVGVLRAVIGELDTGRRADAAD